MMKDRWTDRLSEYLDDELETAERESLERHLAECAACREALEGLRRVAARARALDDRPPAADLWPAIAARIGASRSDRPAVLAFVRRRLTFTVPQLAAAAVALMAVSVAAGMTLLGGGPRPQPSARTSAGAGTAVASQGTLRYDAAVAQLESVLVAGRGVLDSTTIHVIERNLQVIDKAIGEAQRALQADPGNGYLNHHLVDQMRRKLELLRRANALVAARS
jgi:anti-sigma factor RsiW